MNNFLSNYLDVDESSKQEVKNILMKYDRSLLVADPRRREPKKYGGFVPIIIFFKKIPVQIYELTNYLLFFIHIKQSQSQSKKAKVLSLNILFYIKKICFFFLSNQYKFIFFSEASPKFDTTFNYMEKLLPLSENYYAVGNIYYLEK